MRTPFSDSTAESEPSRDRQAARLSFMLLAGVTRTARAGMADRNAPSMPRSSCVKETVTSALTARQRKWSTGLFQSRPSVRARG
jgi:hypothetical protein